jgi:hypothetical protein
MIELKPGESRVFVKPLPNVAPDLAEHVSVRIKARISYKDNGEKDWVNFSAYRGKVWSCDFNYFIKNFVRDERAYQN